jgi:hypothetical protein
MSDSKAPLDQVTINNLLTLSILNAVNCVRVGQIHSINNDSNTVEVKIMARATIDNTQVVEYPLLTDIPLFTLQGSNCFIELPVAEGDFCIVLFNDKDMDSWFLTGGASVPLTQRKHSLSDGLALVGVNASTNPLPLNGGPRVFTGAKKWQMENNAHKASVLFDDLFTLIAELIDIVVGLVTVGTAATQTLNVATQNALNAKKASFNAKKAEFDALYGDN